MTVTRREFLAAGAAAGAGLAVWFYLRHGNESTTLVRPLHRMPICESRLTERSQW